MTDLRAKKRREFDEAIAIAFANEADTMLHEVEPLVDSQAWPAD